MSQSSSSSSLLLYVLVLFVSLSCTTSYTSIPSVSSFSRLYSQKYESVVDIIKDVTTTGTTNKHKKERLDSYLVTLLPQYSRSYLSDLCEKGLVFVNDKAQTKSFKVTNGDKISVDIEDKVAVSKVEPEYIPLDILYEDEHIIAINKPSGMVVHPAPGSPNGTFVNALLYHLGPDATKLQHDTDRGTDGDADATHTITDINSIGDEDIDDIDLDLPETPEAAKASPVSLRPGIVHRLDKGTSGVLLAGKHIEAVAKLSALFAKRNIKKVYTAISIGHPGDTTIVEPIGRSFKNRQLMTVFEGPPGKSAITHVKTVAFDGKLGVVLVRIETGRTHQIRVHLKERRTPIAGDEAYGNSDWNKRLSRSDDIHRPLLHAYEIEFTHPFTLKNMVIKAPIPSDMFNLINKIADPTTSGTLIDNDSRLYTTDTTVKGREPGEKGTGYVPSDRLLVEDSHWTTDKLLPSDDDE